MGSSDSDTESECFESAEESFDENEEKNNEKTKLKKNEQKSENEDSKLVVSDSRSVDSDRAVGKDTSSSSLSYRKRPERLKRLPSKTQTKPVSKSPMNDLVFKADKIVPDVLLQDITSNLSKNFNKSLSTLQQKSSNVKDLILNSLPVSSTDENEKFCYDDISVDDENKTSVPEASHPINNQHVESTKVIEENIKSEKEVCKDKISTVQSAKVTEENIKSEKELLKDEKSTVKSVKVTEEYIKSEKEVHKDEISTVDSAKVIEDKIKNEKEIPRDKISNVESDLVITSDESGNNIEKELEKNITADDNLNNKVETSENSCTEKINIISNKKEEIIQDINNVNKENVEILSIEEKNGKNINESESVDFVRETDQETEICKGNKNIHDEPETNVEGKEEETLKVNESSKPLESDDSEKNQNLAICDEDNFTHVSEDKNKGVTECNFEELKAALKNIVNEENKETKENDQLEDSKDVNENSGEGWDDFDFSDDEGESLNVSESYHKKEFEDVKKNDELTKSNLPVKNVKEAEAKKIKEASVPAKGQAQNTNLNKIEKHKTKEVEKPKMPQETSVVENDSWDWDAWDDISENNEAEVTQTKKPEIKKEKDVSKWSGWDTFGQKQEEKQDNWGLASWGVDTLLNKATAVTQGISSVLEAGLGAPDPVTLARMDKIERENSLEAVNNTENECSAEFSKKNSLTNVNIFPVSGITSLVAGVTSKIVEHSKIQEIGTKVITGGLETLETFGKKTMEVLQEGDPGLKNKRALLLGNNKPVLSQVLKEAREKADRESKKAEEKELAKKCHFETLFDDFQGMVHLEALEMLSRQCELKLEQIRSGMNSEEQEDLNGILEEVEQLCALDEDDLEMKSSMLDFKTLLQMAVDPLKNEISIQNILQIHEDVRKWLEISSDRELSLTVINQKLVSTLAELTAATVHQFHKSGELLSVKECRKTVEEVDALSRLTNALCAEINKLGEKFIKLSSNRIPKGASGDNESSINEKVNDVMKNSVFYIKQAFNLLIPVIQLGAAV